MNHRPRILVTPSTQAAGEELPDHAISIASLYFEAVLDAGGLPMALPLSTDGEVLGDAVMQAHGVLLTGGDDIGPQIYEPDIPENLLKKCHCAEPARDVMELELMRQLLQRPKPLLAICRGHQLVNVALGGTLFADLPSQYPSTIRHSRQDQRMAKVHDISVQSGSQFASITGAHTLGVNSTHHQAIHRVAEPLRPVGLAPDGLVEATELRPEDRRMLPWFCSVQFHPERLFQRHAEHRPLFTAFIGACRAESTRNNH